MLFLGGALSRMREEVMVGSCEIVERCTSWRGGNCCCCVDLCHRYGERWAVHLRESLKVGSRGRVACSLGMMKVIIKPIHATIDFFPNSTLAGDLYPEKSSCSSMYTPVFFSDRRTNSLPEMDFKRSLAPGKELRYEEAIQEDGQRSLQEFVMTVFSFLRIIPLCNDLKQSAFFITFLKFLYKKIVAFNVIFLDFLHGKVVDFKRKLIFFCHFERILRVAGGWRWALYHEKVDKLSKNLLFPFKFMNVFQDLKRLNTTVQNYKKGSVLFVFQDFMGCCVVCSPRDDSTRHHYGHSSAKQILSFQVRRSLYRESVMAGNCALRPSGNTPYSSSLSVYFALISINLFSIYADKEHRCIKK